MLTLYIYMCVCVYIYIYVCVCVSVFYDNFLPFVINIRFYSITQLINLWNCFGVVKAYNLKTDRI
jgi:hypothetical protein